LTSGQVPGGEPGGVAAGAPPDPAGEAARRKTAAEIEKLQAETRLLRQPWRDPRGVLIPLLGAVIGLGSWWQAHVTNLATEEKAQRLVKERDQLLRDRESWASKNAQLEVEITKARDALAAAGATQGSVAAAVARVDAVRQELSDIGRRIEAPSTPDSGGRAAAATVYIQIANDDQRRAWAQHRQVLRDLGYAVPGIENVGARAPERNEVRYFQDTDEARRGAERLVADLHERAGITAVPRYIRGFEGRTKPGTLELWIAP
jgi:hypothetical protein